MPDYKFRVTLPYLSGLPTDVAVNDFSISIAEADVPDAMDAVIAFYNLTGALGGGPVALFLSPDISRDANVCKIDVYDRADPPGTGAVTGTTFTLEDPNPGDTAMPGEVAVVLSMHGDLTAVGVNKARRRGRLYIGPLVADLSRETGGGAIGIRPSNSIIDSLCDVASTFLASVNTAGGDWQVWSTVDNAGVNVVGGWVDDAFDTMRSRGDGPTVRQAWS